MSNLTNADISQVSFQDDVDSYPLRTNFSNIQTAVNDNQSQIDAITTAGSNNEIVNARDYHSVLRDRLRSASKLPLNYEQKNVLITGGAVTINSGDTSKVDIAAGEAVVNGIACKFQAATSAAISAAAASKHRVDVVVIASDNTISIVTGSEVANTGNPPFPAIATSQLSLAAIFVDDTVSVDVTYYIFDLKEDNNFPNYYIKIADTFNQGKYVFNNLIIDETITIDCTSTTGLYNLQRQNVMINCVGNFHTTGDGDFVVAGTHVINVNGKNGVASTSNLGTAGGAVGIVDNIAQQLSLATSIGGNGVGGDINRGAGGGGAGGGASIVATGGAGGDGGEAVSWLAGDPIGSSADTNVMPCLIIKAYNIDIGANITLDGKNGGDGGTGGLAGFTDAGGGGAGGNAGGILMLLGINDITIGASATVSCDGGNGGDGGDAITGTTNNGGGGGGGGGAGGLILIRSKSYTNNGTVQCVAGSGGTGGSASGGSGSNVAGDNGTAGSAGLVDQTLYDTKTFTEFNDLWEPINIFGLEI